MSEIVLGEPLASEIRKQAESQGVDVESFIESALKHYRFHAQWEKLNEETAWWQSRSPEERAKYRGKYVAIHKNELVDHDSDDVAVRGRIRKKYGKTPVLIPPAEGMREYHVVSTRLYR